MMKPRLILTSLILGGALTLLSLWVSYDYCLNGWARGLPFPLILPRCEASFASVSLWGDQAVHVLDLARGAANLVLWSCLVLGGWQRLTRRNVWRFKAFRLSKSGV